MLNADPVAAPSALNALVSSREITVPAVSLRDQIVCSVVQLMLPGLSNQFTSIDKYDMQMERSKHMIRLALRVALDVGDMYDEIRGEVNDVEPQNPVEASEGQSEKGLGEQ